MALCRMYRKVCCISKKEEGWDIFDGDDFGTDGYFFAPISLVPFSLSFFPARRKCVKMQLVIVSPNEIPQDIQAQLWPSK